MLLCAPYRFASSYPGLTRGRRVLGVDDAALSPAQARAGDGLLSVVPAPPDPSAVRRCLKENFNIVDADSTRSAVDDLAAGRYRVNPQSFQTVLSAIVEQSEAAGDIARIAGDRGPQGFDDCRIVDLLARAYAGGLLDEAAFVQALSGQGERIAASYSGWEQYHASCALGEMVHAGTAGWLVGRREDFLTAILECCFPLAQAFDRASYWPKADLREVGRLVSALLPPSTVGAVAPAALPASQSAGPPAHEYPQPAAELLGERASLGRTVYPRAAALAEYALWGPARQAGGDWMLTGWDREDLGVLLPMPVPSPQAGRMFWIEWSKDSKGPYEGVQFARLSTSVRCRALLTDAWVYDREKKPFRKTVITPIPWERAAFTAETTPLGSIKILLNGRKVGLIPEPAYDMIGEPRDRFLSVSPKEGEAFLAPYLERLNGVLAELGTRVRRFSEEHSEDGGRRDGRA